MFRDRLAAFVPRGLPFWNPLVEPPPSILAHCDSSSPCPDVRVFFFLFSFSRFYPSSFLIAHSSQLSSRNITVSRLTFSLPTRTRLNPRPLGKFFWRFIAALFRTIYVRLAAPLLNSFSFSPSDRSSLGAVSLFNFSTFLQHIPLFAIGLWTPHR